MVVAQKLQDGQHIVGDTRIHIPEIDRVPPAIFLALCQASKKLATRRDWPVSRDAIVIHRWIALSAGSWSTSITVSFFVSVWLTKTGRQGSRG